MKNEEEVCPIGGINQRRCKDCTCYKEAKEDDADNNSNITSGRGDTGIRSASLGDSKGV